MRSQDWVSDVGHQPLTQELGAPGDEHDDAEGDGDAVQRREDAILEGALQGAVDDEHLDVEGDCEEGVSDDCRAESLLVRSDVASEAAHELRVVEGAVFLVPSVGH